ncbi:MAG: hypothetical protein QOJ46_123, partial [bacterium]
MQGRTILALVAACVMLGACGSDNSSDKGSSSSNATKPAT